MMKRISQNSTISFSSTGSTLLFGLSLKTRAHILLLTCQLCWSMWHVIGSLALSEGVNPIIFALYREITASICMLLVVFIVVGPKLSNLYIDREDIIRFIVLGFCSFVNVVFAIVALEYVPATTFAVMQPIIPCIATFISVVVGLEQSSIMKISGILLAVAGAIIIEAWKTGGNTNDDGDDTLKEKRDYLKGYIIIGCQVTAMASLIVFQKSLLAKYPPPVVSFTYYFIGSLFTCLLCIIWGSHYKVDEWIFDKLTLPWYALLYASLVATVFTFTSVSWSVKRLPPSVTTVYWTWQPVFTATLSFLILHQLIHLNEIIGGLLVALGLTITLQGRENEIKTHRDYSSVAANDAPINPLQQNGLETPLNHSLLPLNNTDDYIALRVTDEF